MLQVTSEALEIDAELAEIVCTLRKLLAARGWAFGALFIANAFKQHGDRGFIFADGMPGDLRVQLLDNMQTGLDRARKRFSQ
jgi:hypothetical protein